MTDRIHVRSELPWLRSGPLWRVHTSALPAVDVLIAREAFLRIDLDGTRMTSRADAHRELARAFAFPDWYGANWDAFHDCWYEFAERHAADRVAVIWHDVDAAAEAAPLTTVEVGWALLQCALGEWPTPGPMPPTTMVLELFAVTASPDGDRPASDQSAV